MSRFVPLWDLTPSGKARKWDTFGRKNVSGYDEICLAYIYARMFLVPLHASGTQSIKHDHIISQGGVSYSPMRWYGGFGGLSRSHCWSQ